jgi:hypothetical protein
MNITDFRNNVLSLNLNKAEITRINNLTASNFKFLVVKFTEFSYKNINELNFKKVWFEINKILAKEDKFHRIQTHSMRNYRGYSDYSHLAYNGVTEDF